MVVVVVVMVMVVMVMVVMVMVMMMMQTPERQCFLAALRRRRRRPSARHRQQRDRSRLRHSLRTRVVEAAGACLRARRALWQLTHRPGTCPQAARRLRSWMSTLSCKLASSP